MVVSDTPSEGAKIMQMFSSSRKVEPAMPMTATEPTTPPVPKPAGNSSIETAHTGGTLSSGVSIKGNVKFSKELQIDCEVEGKIEATGRLTIGKNAQIKGEIRTKSVIVDGT